MSEYITLYRFSLAEAKHLGETQLWRDSYRANCDCARMIERAIHNGFDGFTLNQDGILNVIHEFGLSRVNWVLANTIREKEHDGRFSPDNILWAKRLSVPKDATNWQYCVEAHPGLTNLVTDIARSEWDSLHLFSAEQCVRGEKDFCGKVLVLDPETLSDDYRLPEYQLFLASFGSGTSENARGKKVFGKFLRDGEHCSFCRQDFLGVLDAKYLPDWAKEKLESPVQVQEMKMEEL